MSKKAWIIVLVGVAVAVAVGVGLAIVLDDGGGSQSSAETAYCSSLNDLETSVSEVAAADPSSTTPDQLEPLISGAQNAWRDVQSAASNLASANQSSLVQAWNGFQSAVDTSAGSSTQSIVSAAQILQSAAQSSLESYDCSS